MNMDAERKQELIRKARRVLHGKALDDYINFVLNYEARAAANDLRLRQRYPVDPYYE